MTLDLAIALVGVDDIEGLIYQLMAIEEYAK